MLGNILAAFRVPMEISNDAWSFFYIVPLAIVLSVVYKATKITVFSWYALARESVILIASVLVFMAVVAASLYAFCAVVLR
jgi:hypothetical protein